MGTGGLVLWGIDGSNPLGFLAALGTLRTLAKFGPDPNVQMAWIREAGAWRPIVLGSRSVERLDLVDAVHNALQDAGKSWELPVEENLKLEPPEYRQWASRALETGEATELIAALATDAAVVTKGVNAGKVATSHLQMVNGGKRQDFLRIVKAVVHACERPHIENTLFEEWRYEDSMQSLNLRWDPADDRQYALRWQNPSDAQTRKRGSQLGANRLAIEAIPLFTVCGTGQRRTTTGFAAKRQGGATEFRWPIWIPAAPLDVVRSLVNHAELQKPELDADARSNLRELGILKVFGARRYSVDKYRTASFAASAPV